MKTARLARILLSLSLGATATACGDDASGGDEADSDMGMSTGQAGDETGIPDGEDDDGSDASGGDSSGGMPGGTDDPPVDPSAAAPGELVITELMIDVEGDDEGREWFEVQNISDREVSLDSLVLVDEGDDREVDIHDPDTTLGAGEHIVFAESSAADLPEGTRTYYYGSELGFDNGKGGLSLRVGEELIDRVQWDREEGWPIVKDNTMSLDAAAMTPADNDFLQGWCANPSGTPGASNPACGEQGTTDPMEGALVITEVMASPIEGADWLEIRNTSRGTVRLHGMDIVVGDDTITIADGGLEIPAGGVLVFTEDVAALGDDVLAYSLSDLSLGSSETIELRFADALIDAVRYDRDEGWLLQGGRSLSLDPSRTNPASNDDVLNWCLGSAKGLTGQGTPGAANGSCAYVDDVPFPENGELQITEVMVDAPGNDGGQEWFEVYNAGDNAVRLDGLEVSNGDDDERLGEVGVALPPGEYGVLSQSAEFAAELPGVAAAYGDGVTFGNASGSVLLRFRDEQIAGQSYDASADWPVEEGASLVLTAPEVGGNNGGLLAAWCESTVASIAMGTPIFGSPGTANETCITDLAPPPAQGELVISEFMAKVEGEDDGHEWIEIHNTAASARRLNGVTLHAGNDEHEIDLLGLEIAAGGYVVLAASDASPDETGGAPAYTYGDDLSLDNLAARLALTYDDTLLDEVTYDEADPMWLVTSGYSASLHRTSTDAEENDAPLNWCLGWAPIGETGLRGTPGSSNDACPLRAGDGDSFEEDPGAYDLDVLEAIDMHITVDAAELAALEGVMTLEEKDASVPAAATFSAEGYEALPGIANATLELRGQTSISAPQKSWKIKLSGETFRDQKTLHLSKHTFDATRLRSQLGARVLRDVPDLPGLRSQFVHLYVNGEDYGLFNQMEHVDERFLRRRNFDERGYLFKATLFSFAEPTAEELASQTLPGLEPKIIEDYAGVFAMLGDLHDDGQSWDDIVDAHFDRENLMNFFASMYLMKNLDTTWQNFYIYAPVNDPERFYFIPWDFDGAWDWYAQDPQVLADWRSGFGNWWDNQLWRRMFRDEAFVNDVATRVNELGAAAFAEPEVQAIVDDIDGIARPFQSSSPDGDPGNQPAAAAQRDDEVAYLAGVGPARVLELLDTLERPMPFTTAIASLGSGDLLFTWDPSYDIQGDTVEYSIAIATGGCGWLEHDCFTDNILMTFDGLSGTSTVMNRTDDLGGLAAGEYQFLIYSSDDTGATQTCYQHNFPRSFTLD